jgi:DNA modification methylase
MTVRILQGDCREVLRTLPDESVHCVVTSPPYFGLRDYQTGTWEGGDPACDHGVRRWEGDKQTQGAQSGHASAADKLARQRCPCGAVRIDRQIGLEPTPDAFVAEMVAVFREVRRVLRSDGTLWLNLGDSYASAPGQGTRGGPPSKSSTLEGNGHKGGGPKLAQLPRVGTSGNRGNHAADTGRRPFAPGLKPKDLIGIPWRVAFALQADGWWLRQDIIWCLSGGAWLYARTPTKVGPMMLKDLVRLAPETVELWNGERWTRVTAWTKCQGRTEAVEIVLRSGERIGCTGNHVWPTGRGNIRTDELRRGDIIRSTLLPDGERPQGWITDEAFWFAGLYLAEGSRSGETIQISGHVNEADERLRRLRALVSHYGGSARAYTAGNTHNIHIDSIGISAVLRSLIAGKTAKDKRLAPAAWQYPNWQLRQIVEGYLHGDGHVDGDRVRLGFCRNYDLERDLRCLAARLGATLTLKPTVAKNQNGSFASFKGEWRWSRSGHVNERDRSEIVEIRNSRARQFWDVTVADEPHLFALASGVLTHNSKPNPMPESVTDRCTKAHEYLFLLTKSARYYYDAEAVAEPVAPSTVERLAQPTLDAQVGSDRVPGKTNGRMKAVPPRFEVNKYGDDDADEHRTKSGNEYEIKTGKRNRRTVWTVATQPFSEAHFATFPPALIEPCIAAGCPKGGVILDPFGGAGTTGLVADRLGRDAILIELNPDYAAMAERRIRSDANLLSDVRLESPSPEHTGAPG